MRSLYSVPTRYIGKTARVRVDRATVRIYLGAELVKAHPRVAPGKRSTDVTDYPVGKGVVATRDVDSLVAAAKERGHHVGVYAERLLAVPLPWTRMRLVYALLRLCKKYGDGQVEAVCQSSLGFDVVDVSRITRMLETALAPPQPARDEPRKVVAIATPRFARSTEHFVTRVAAKDGAP